MADTIVRDCMRAQTKEDRDRALRELIDAGHAEDNATRWTELRWELCAAIKARGTGRNAVLYDGIVYVAREDDSGVMLATFDDINETE